jgi:hypothetical protein
MTTAELKPLNCKQPFSSLNYWRRSQCTRGPITKKHPGHPVLVVAFERITCQSSPAQRDDPFICARQFFYADGAPIERRRRR